MANPKFDRSIEKWILGGKSISDGDELKINSPHEYLERGKTYRVLENSPIAKGTWNLGDTPITTDMDLEWP